MMKATSLSDHACIYCGKIWSVSNQVEISREGNKLKGAACPRCGNETLYKSGWNQEMGIVSPGLLYLAEEKYYCQTCGLFYTKKGSCPRCGERVKDADPKHP